MVAAGNGMLNESLLIIFIVRQSVNDLMTLKKLGNALLGDTVRLLREAAVGNIGQWAKA